MRSRAFIACHRSHFAWSVNQICASHRVSASNKGAVFRADTPTAIDDGVEPLKRNVQPAGRLNLRYPEWLEELLTRSVIVGATNVVRVLTGEPEDDLVRVVHHARQPRIRDSSRA
jgi:hypothetical protein